MGNNMEMQFTQLSKEKIKMECGKMGKGLTGNELIINQAFFFALDMLIAFLDLNNCLSRSLVSFMFTYFPF